MAWVTLTCKHCGKSFDALFKVRNKRKYCTPSCSNAAHAGAGNPMFGRPARSKETHPEWAARIAVTHRERGSLVGDKNPMKRSDVASRMSKTRREKVTSDPAYRAHLSQKMREAWVDGKYEGVRVGQCDWHEHTRPNGEVVKLQGTWELALARFLDQRGIDYEAHRGRVPYHDSEGTERSYYPDLRIPALDAYVDVKNPLYEREHAKKLECVRACNPDMTLVVLNKQALEGLGVI